MIERLEGEPYVSFMKRVIVAVKNDDIDYTEMGDALLGEDNVYSSDNSRKAFYFLDKICKKIDDKEVTLARNRILCIADLHVPFQKDINCFEKFRNASDTLVLDGDLIDFVQISKFRKVCRNTPMEDIVSLWKYVIELIEYINPKEVYANDGNHEKRFEAYLQKNVENDLIELMPSSVLELIFEDGFYHYDRKHHSKTWHEPISKIFKDKKIVYTHSWHNQIGDTIFAHPSAFSSGTLSTCLKAVRWFNDNQYSFNQIILAHTHHRGEATIGKIDAIESGCCCETKDNIYNDGYLTNPQQEGFVYICQDKDGNTIREMTEKVRLN